jgi:3-methyladenine DNA glycosylase AlkC
MAEPFKNFIDRALVGAAGRHLQQAWQGFDRPRFERLALDGLDALELKARAMHVADALEATLPADFEAAAHVIEAALAPPQDPDRDGLPGGSGDGLAGWIGWPLGEFVVRRGLHHPQRALRVLREITQRFTSEFAIRPFIVAYPALVFETLAKWVHDPSAHVRRLVSEGTRPRLPWGLQLKSLVADPTPALPLLAALQDDPSGYVRRSVANHLNDIAKDHPDLVVDWIRRHLPDASRERRALLAHASRTLVKRGHRPMLEAWGVGAAWQGAVHLQVSPRRIRIGESLRLEVRLSSTAHQPQSVVIDYAVHHRRADGTNAAKVFKGWTLTLEPGFTRALTKTHSMRPVTTRRYHPGPHEVDLRINGHEVARSGFVLSAARDPGA